MSIGKTILTFTCKS